MKRVIFTTVALILMATSAWAADVPLAWDAVQGASGYKIQMSTNSGASWSTAKDAGANATYTWTGAPDTGLCLFRVSAYNAQGEAIRTNAGAWFNGSWTVPRQPGGLGVP